MSIINKNTNNVNILLLFCLLAITTIPVESKPVNNTWNENFNVSSITDLTGWDLQCYQIDVATGILKEAVEGFNISNNKLVAPASTAFLPLNRALHDSTVAFGNWSFEWTVGSQDAYDAVEFIFTDNGQHPYNSTGKLYPDGDYIAGYALRLISYYKDTAPGVSLYRFNNGSSRIPSFLASYSIPVTEMKGSHNIEITRDSKGEFNVYFDSNLTINVTDLTWISSEKFNFVSFQGNSSISNIQIDDKGIVPPTSTTLPSSSTPVPTSTPTTSTTNPTNTPPSTIGVLSGLIFLTLVVLKRRNMKNKKF